MFELLGSAAMVISWLIPDHYLPWLSAYNDSVMALGLMLLMAGLVRRDSSKACVPAAFWVTVAVAGIPWLHWATGRLAFGGDAVVGSLYALALAVAILTGHGWARRDPTGSAALLAGTILLGGSLSAVIALFQGLRVGDLGLWGLGLCTEAELARTSHSPTISVPFWAWQSSDCCCFENSGVSGIG